jgi:hypothetical protein
LIEKDDHSCPSANVSQPLRANFGFLGQVPVHHGGDFQSLFLDAKLVDYLLGVGEAFLRAVFVGHAKGMDIFWPKCSSAKKGNHCGVDAPRESKHDFAHVSATFDFALKKADKPFRDERSVDF